MVNRARVAGMILSIPQSRVDGETAITLMSLRSRNAFAKRSWAADDVFATAHRVGLREIRLTDQTSAIQKAIVGLEAEVNARGQVRYKAVVSEFSDYSPESDDGLIRASGGHHFGHRRMAIDHRDERIPAEVWAAIKAVPAEAIAEARARAAERGREIMRARWDGPDYGATQDQLRSPEPQVVAALAQGLKAAEDEIRAALKWAAEFGGPVIEPVPAPFVAPKPAQYERAGLLSAWRILRNAPSGGAPARVRKAVHRLELADGDKGAADRRIRLLERWEDWRYRRDNPPTPPAEPELPPPSSKGRWEFPADSAEESPFAALAKLKES